jgi:hypothetical protein
MTLKITKGETNKLVVTLSELASPNLPNNWLFVFTKDQDGQVYKTYLTDISLSTDWYNEFMFDETDMPMQTGDYSYYAYQMPNGGSEDQTTGLLVENGKVRVIEQLLTVTAYKSTKQTKNYEREN